jgi:hypothetical protein
MQQRQRRCWAVKSTAFEEEDVERTTGGTGLHVIDIFTLVPVTDHLSFSVSRVRMGIGLNVSKDGSRTQPSANQRGSGRTKGQSCQ